MGEKEKSIGSSIILNQQNWLKIVLNYSVLLRDWIIANDKNIYFFLPLQCFIINPTNDCLQHWLKFVQCL